MPLQGEKQEVNVGVTSGPVSAHFPRRLGRLVDFYFYFWSLEQLPGVVVKTWRTHVRERSRNFPQAAADLLNEPLLGTHEGKVDGLEASKRLRKSRNISLH